MHNITTPAIDDNAIEVEIKSKGKTAARVTPADIDAAIASTHYFTAAHAYIGAAYVRTMDSGGVINAGDGEQPPQPLYLLTFCVLVLQNGFTVTGESACASPENFDAEIGRKVALANAKAKIWPLLGYALKDRLAAA